MSPDTVRVTISVVSGSLALCFNALLACIILTTKCFYIGKYKYLLFLYTISAVMYSIAQITTAGVSPQDICSYFPVSTPRKSTYCFQNFLMFPDGYMFYDTFRILPIAIANIVVDMYVSSFIQNVVILTLSFTYRYLVICKCGNSCLKF